MATIRKREWKSGGTVKTAWIADYLDQSGKRHIKTCRTRKDADAFLVQARHEVARGVHTAESESITVREAAGMWTEKGRLDGLERSTLRQRGNHVELHIAPLIGEVKLARLSTPAIEAFRDEMLKKGSRAMARKVLTSLKGILGEAQRRGLVAHNAALPVKVEFRKRDQRKLAFGRDIPTKEEIRSLLAKSEGRWRPLFVAAIFTGMRASELRGLEWEDIDLEAGTIYVRQRANLWGEIGSPKSAAGEREIPMAPIVANALREWKLACPRQQSAGGERLRFVFSNGAGRVENHANILNRGFYPLQIDAGVVTSGGRPKYNFHSLRHFFASWLIEQGFPPKRIQTILGHSSIQMTYDVYGHLFLTPEDDRARFAAGQLALVS